MTSKERVRAALRREQPDRVPAGMSCVDVTWERLQKHLGLPDTEAVLSELEIDIRYMDLPPYLPGAAAPKISPAGEEVFTHPFGWEYVKKWNGVEWNPYTTRYPLEGVDTPQAFEQFTGWADPDHFDYTAVEALCRKHPDKAIQIGWPGPFQVFTYYMPMEQMFILMAEEDVLMQQMLARYMDLNLEIYSRMLEAGAGQVDILRCCDDYGTQISMLFSLPMWRAFFEENTRRLTTLAHRHGAFYMQHSCGAVRPILPELIRAGVDALDPVQKVTGMEPGGLSRDFGHMLTFHGGVDTQHLLPFGTPEEVRQETASVIRAFSATGGYILAPSQSFEGDVPVENILAMYDARWNI